MSRRCELTGVGPMVGHNVSHSNIKTKRRFLPALAPATLQSDAAGPELHPADHQRRPAHLDFRGGLDAFLIKAKRRGALAPRPEDQEAGQGQAGGASERLSFSPRSAHFLVTLGPGPRVQRSVA